MSALDQIEAFENEQSTEDRICIVRDHATGEIAWRFGTKQMSPIELMQWAMFYDMITNSGYRARIEALEAKVEALTLALSQEKRET